MIVLTNKQSTSALLFLACMAGLAPPTEAEVSISFCVNQPDCICVDWSTSNGTFLEVRCPEGGGTGGWTEDPDGSVPDGGNGGGWNGPGTEQPPSDPHPGSPLEPAVNIKWSQAVGKARQVLRGDTECCVAGKPYNVPNECTNLFSGNPMGRTGLDLLDSYMIARRGEGVQGPSGQTPCSSGGTSAWTTCCGHSPYIFVCDRFANEDTNIGAALVIHEIMHIAGQTEDGSGTVGPGDAPTTHQITDAVREACGL